MGGLGWVPHCAAAEVEIPDPPIRFPAEAAEARADGRAGIPIQKRLGHVARAVGGEGRSVGTPPRPRRAAVPAEPCALISRTGQRCP